MSDSEPLSFSPVPGSLSVTRDQVIDIRENGGVSDVTVIILSGGCSVTVRGDAPELIAVVVAEESTFTLEGDAPKLETLVVGEGSFFFLNGEAPSSYDDYTVVFVSGVVVVNGKEFFSFLSDA